MFTCSLQSFWRICFWFLQPKFARSETYLQLCTTLWFSWILKPQFLRVRSLLDDPRDSPVLSGNIFFLYYMHVCTIGCVKVWQGDSQVVYRQVLWKITFDVQFQKNFRAWRYFFQIQMGRWKLGRFDFNQSFTINTRGFFCKKSIKQMHFYTFFCLCISSEFQWFQQCLKNLAKTLISIYFLRSSFEVIFKQCENLGNNFRKSNEIGPLPLLGIRNVI